MRANITIAEMNKTTSLGPRLLDMNTDRLPSGVLRRCLVVGSLGASLLISLGYLLFSSAGRDDAYITYWAAYSLSNFGQVLNYNGELLEQSSSLLHVLMLASLDGLGSGLSLVTLGHLSSIAGGVLCLLILPLLTRRCLPGIGTPTMLLLSTASYFVYWSWGGMETTFAALALVAWAWALIAYLQQGTPGRLCAVALTAFGALLVRPEMPMVLIGGLVGTLGLFFLQAWHQKQERIGVEVRRALLSCGLVGLLALGIGGVRVAVFGAPFGQPAVAKFGGLSSEVLFFGLHYLIVGLMQDPGQGIGWMVGVGTVLFQLYRGIVSAQREGPRCVLVALVMVYLAFILTAGGDWMEGGRFAVPILPLVYVLLAWTLAEHIRTSAWRRALVGGMVVLQGVGMLYFVTHYSAGTPLWGRSDLPHIAERSFFEKHNRINLRDVPTSEYFNEVIALVQAEKQGMVYIMSRQMGMVMYHAARQHYGSIRTIDQFSLVDRVFTACPVTKDLPRGRLGIAVPKTFFFDHAVELSTQCQIPMPDIIFDIVDDWHVVTEQGYTVVYQQRGWVRHGAERLLPGRRVPAEQGIAVRNDWVERLPALQRRRELDFEAYLR